MKLSERQGMIWIDGQWVQWQDAKVHVLTNTLHYGMGAFEGVRAYSTEEGPAIFRLKEHTDRFFRSAHILKMNMPFSKEVINQAQCDILVKNKLQSAYIRLVIFYGSEHLGVHPAKLSTHVVIAAWEWGSYFNIENQETGIKAQISSYSRNHAASGVLKAKANGNYINSTLALQDAKAFGCEEAILLDTRGFIAEGTSSNIFIVRDGILYTPTTSAILEGITRATVITLAKAQGITVIEKNLTRDDIYAADEVFSTGTAAEITAITNIDHRAIAPGLRGPITQKIQERYSKITCGKDTEYQHWLSYAEV